MYRNSEGYADPTAGIAIARVMREERMKRRIRCRRKEKELRSNKACHRFPEAMNRCKNQSHNGERSGRRAVKGAKTK